MAAQPFVVRGLAGSVFCFLSLMATLRPVRTVWPVASNSWNFASDLRRENPLLSVLDAFPDRDRSRTWTHFDIDYALTLSPLWCSVFVPVDLVLSTTGPKEDPTAFALLRVTCHPPGADHVLFGHITLAKWTGRSSESILRKLENGWHFGFSQFCSHWCDAVSINVVGAETFDSLPTGMRGSCSKKWNVKESSLLEDYLSFFNKRLVQLVEEGDVPRQDYHITIDTAWLLAPTTTFDVRPAGVLLQRLWSAPHQHSFWT